MTQQDVHSTLPACTLGSPHRGNILTLAVAAQARAQPRLPSLLLLLSLPQDGPSWALVPEAPVLAVLSWWLPLTAVSGHLCSHSDGVCLGEHHGAVVEGHWNAALPWHTRLLALASSHWVLLLLLLYLK